MMKMEFFGNLVPERDEASRLRRVAQSEIPVKVEDGGQALIAEFYGRDDEETGMWVRVHSWDPDKKHELMQHFMNARVRVTVEVLD